jgi:hypothetical protein
MVATNVLQLGEVADFRDQAFANIKQILIRKPTV